MMDPVNRGNGYHMMMEYLCEFENELTRCGMYFGGAEPGFLDFQIYPWLSRIGVWTPEFMKTEHVSSFKLKFLTKMTEKGYESILQDWYKGSFWHIFGDFMRS